MPRVSLGMPVYNGAKFIRAALESLRAQEFADWELIISDNASSDATEEICQAYIAMDSRIRYHRSARNMGASANFNRVFSLATGEYFKWATHDDMCAPANLRRCVDVLDSHGPDVILSYGRTVLIDERGHFLGHYDDRMDLRSPAPHERLARVLRDLRLCHVDMGLVRRHVLATTGLLRPFPSSDRVLVAELALRGKFIEVPEPLFFRRWHAGTSVRAHTTVAEHMQWFDPDRNWRVAAPSVRVFLGFLSAIYHAPVAWHVKARCLGTLLQERLNRLGRRTQTWVRSELNRLFRSETCQSPPPVESRD